MRTRSPIGLQNGASTGPTSRDWSAFALLLIDVQRDFWPEATATAFPEFPANVSRLLAFCRAEGIDVVHVRAQFRPDRSDWLPRARLRGRIPCVEGTPGAEPLPCALEQPGEPVFLKQAFDAFRAENIEAHLQGTGKRFLLCAGLVTSVCVLLTAAAAAQRDLLAAIVEDCCADEPVAHTQTLLRYGGFFFRRTTVDRLLDDYAGWCADLRQLGSVP